MSDEQYRRNVLIREHWHAEVARLHAELLAVRRLVLPHPEAAPDPGCGCDTVPTDAAVRDALRARDAVIRGLAERLAACSEVLGRAAERGKVCRCQTPGEGRADG